VKLWRMMEQKNIVPGKAALLIGMLFESNISTMTTGGQDYIVGLAVPYRLDSRGIISWWGRRTGSRRRHSASKPTRNRSLQRRLDSCHFERIERLRVPQKPLLLSQELLHTAHRLPVNQ